MLVNQLIDIVKSDVEIIFLHSINWFPYSDV